MIDYYKFNFLSALGRDAGNESMPEFLRTSLGKYDEFLKKAKEMKDKGLGTKQDTELYL